MTRLIALNDRAWPAVTLLLVAAVTVLSLTPMPALDLPEPVTSDKLHHFIAYGAIAFPVALARPRRWRWYLLMFAFWGAVIELIQPQVGRQAALGDVLANCGGILAGLAAAGLLRRLAPHPERA